MAAKAANLWLDDQGYTNIILASTGNGCHLLVPCELPNDKESKELICKVQRVVAKLFSTDEVEVECFPDANRLVRGYGTVNRKGHETAKLKYRMSGLIDATISTAEPISYRDVMLRIVAENPMPEVGVIRHSGGGSGPFTRDILEARLEAWREHTEFEFQETNRHDGFAILCPGNTIEAWLDGMQHDDVTGKLDDSSIVYVRNGWPVLSCRHNHCAEGSEKSKKTWWHLQEFYDPKRQYHRLEQEPLDLAKYGIEMDGV